MTYSLGLLGIPGVADLNEDGTISNEEVILYHNPNFHNIVGLAVAGRPQHSPGPLLDSDGDGVPDAADMFPKDPRRSGWEAGTQGYSTTIPYTHRIPAKAVKQAEAADEAAQQLKSYGDGPAAANAAYWAKSAWQDAAAGKPYAAGKDYKKTVAAVTAFLIHQWSPI